MILESVYNLFNILKNFIIQILEKLEKFSRIITKHTLV